MKLSVCKLYAVNNISKFDDFSDEVVVSDSAWTDLPRAAIAALAASGEDVPNGAKIEPAESDGAVLVCDGVGEPIYRIEKEG